MPAPVLTDGAAALNAIPADNRDQLLQLADSLAAVSPESAPEFLRSAPTVLERVTFAQLQEWQSEGAMLCRTSPAAAASYFRMESTRSEEILDSLSSSIELVRVSDVLRMYCGPSLRRRSKSRRRGNLSTSASAGSRATRLRPKDRLSSCRAW